jgi:hypothetical protein
VNENTLQVWPRPRNTTRSGPQATVDEAQPTSRQSNANNAARDANERRRGPDECEGWGARDTPRRRPSESLNSYLGVDVPILC